LLTRVFNFCAQRFAFAHCKHTSFAEFLAAKKPRSCAQHMFKIPNFCAQLVKPRATKTHDSKVRLRCDVAPSLKVQRYENASRESPFF
jgi:hypothetical protein